MSGGTKSAARERPEGASSGDEALPTAIVIGAQKCGTSGLHYYLGLHPDVATSEPKEVNFFIAERAWPNGVDWYRGRFDAESPVRVEASPNYTAHPQFAGVPERMAAVVPGAKLIYLVRDPIDRIAAHWVHNYSKGRHDGELAETIVKPTASYIDRSRYAMQLERFLTHFDSRQILVLENEDLRRNRAETLRRVFEFIGADPAFSDRGFATERHQTTRKTRLTTLGRKVERAWPRSDAAGLAAKSWSLARSYWPLGRRIERPDVLAAIPDDVLGLLREDARRLVELTGLDVEHWSLWRR